MSHTYVAVGWNRQKRLYDGVLCLSVLVFLAAFVGIGFAVRPEATAETLLIRALGLCAFALLHVILSIGPLGRLDRRFLPLLYNRRHMGVALAGLGLAHGAFALYQFHGSSDVNPLVSLFTSNMHYASLARFPFQTLGFAALMILLLMAVTSHDFWLSNLTAPVWKTLHMCVYAAYALLVGHVAVGSMQADTGPVLPVLVGTGLFWILSLHLIAGWREARRERAPRPAPDGFVDVCSVDEILEHRARVVTLAGERAAVFRSGGQVFALSSVCQHQNGPLGEGCVRDGLVTCPWHGYQYEPASGCSPPPFTERVPTFDVRVEVGRVLVRSTPNALGARAQSGSCAPRGNGAAPELYVGYLPAMARPLARFLRPRVAALALCAAALSAALAATQGDFGPGVFEFGTRRTFEGLVAREPVPMLLLRRPGLVSERGAFSRFLLVGEGKRGAGREIAGLEGRLVRLEGTLIWRDGATLIEVVSGSVTPLAEAAPLGQPDQGEVLGTFTLRGEIVDSKCFLGVMKPGEGKTHRSCAIRCILGGIPPVLAVREPDGTATYLLLVGPDGEPINERIVDRVAEPVEARGSVERQGDLLLLRVAPESIRRIE